MSGQSGHALPESKLAFGPLFLDLPTFRRSAASGGFGPIPTKVQRSKRRLFDHRVRSDKKRLWHREAECLGGLEVDY